MKSILPALIRFCRSGRKLFSSLTVVSLVLATLYVVHSQNPSDPTLRGESGSVLLVPHRTVNAGEVKFKPDTDHDGMSDADEAHNGTNPDDPSDADADNDGDGLTNGDEVAAGTNPNSADSDGDGVSDGEEVSLGYNPLDPSNTPPTGAALASLQVTPNPVVISVNTLLGQDPVQLRVIGVRTDSTTFDLTASPTLTYQSLDENVALVDSFGNVAGFGGTTTVRVISGTVTADVQVLVSSFTPTPLSAITIPGYANNVDVAGDYAYVAAGSAGLVVVDVHDRSNPVIVATLDTPGNADDVRVVGTTAFVADGSSGLQIIDVSTPSNPSVVGSFDTPGEANDVVVRGTRVYVADGASGIQIIDVSNLSAPAAIGSVDTPGIAKGVDVSGDLIVVADDAHAAAAVRIIDAANPASAHIVGSVALQGSALDLEVRDRFAYVASYGAGIQLIDFSVPNIPRVVSTVGGFVPRDVALGNKYAVEADAIFANATPILDLGDPGNPLFAGVLTFSYPGNFYGTGVATDAHNVYLTSVNDPNSVTNGETGDSRLFIGELLGPGNDLTDTAGIAPSVRVTSPTNNDSTIEGSQLQVSIIATDDVGVALVQLIVNDVVVVRDVANPYTVTYTVPPGAPTTLTIQAKAFDIAGNTAVSTPVTIDVLPDPPPTVTITSPGEGEILTEGQTITLFADVVDNGFADAVFTVDGNTYPNGSYYFVPLGSTSLTVQVTATDNVGQTASATRTVGVVPDPPPTVNIVTPIEGSQFIEGQDLEFVADASDNVSIDHLDFTVNGILLAADSQPPYQQAYRIPLGTTSMLLEAAAVDNLGQRTVASRTFTVTPDPGTTVTGQVVDTSAQPVSGATVTLPEQVTAQTGADGRFSIPHVSTVHGDILARITAVINGNTATNASLPFPPVSGGTTDLGVVTLSVSPTAPTAFAIADYDGDFVPDIFVGYPDRQSLIYSLNGGQFTPSANRILPYGSVNSGASLSLANSQKQIFAQLVGRPGSVVSVSFDGGTMQAPKTVATGLGGESEFTAAGLDPQQQPDGSNRAVLAFLTNGSGSTSLTVRFGDDSAAGYSDPVSLPVDSAAPLRSLTLTDIDHDGLLDLLVLKPLTGTDANVIVYLRTSPTTFGSPIESPVTVRTTVPAKGAVDFVIGKFGGNFFQTDIAVLGDDRVRIYQGNGHGAFTSGQEIIVPAGKIATGITGFDVTKDGRSDVIVTAKDASTPGSRFALLYFNSFGGTFLSPVTKTYTAPISSGDTRVGITDLGGDFRSLDMVVVDGDVVRVFLDVGPVRSGS